MAEAQLAAFQSVNSKRRSLRGAAKQSNARARDLEQRIWTLLSEGKTPSAIARKVGIARQSVHRIIRRVEARYHKVLEASVERLKARQARALDAVLDEALDAWERSKQPARRVRKQSDRSGPRKSHSGGHTELTRTEVESQVGDPRFLAEARQALADQRKLWGLDAPKSGSSFEQTPTTCTVEWSD